MSRSVDLKDWLLEGLDEKMKVGFDDGDHFAECVDAVEGSLLVVDLLEDGPASEEGA